MCWAVAAKMIENGSFGHLRGCNWYWSQRKLKYSVYVLDSKNVKLMIHVNEGCIITYHIVLLWWEFSFLFGTTKHFFGTLRVFCLLNVYINVLDQTIQNLQVKKHTKGQILCWQDKMSVAMYIFLYNTRENPSKLSSWSWVLRR